MSRDDRVPLLYSLMSRRIIARSSSNRNSASARASSVLPTPVGPRNRNEPIGRRSSPSPARERRTAFATADERLLLTDHALAQLVLHAQELLHLALEHLGDGDAGPLRDDRGDVLVGDLFLQVAPSSPAPAPSSPRTLSSFFSSSGILPY